MLPPMTRLPRRAGCCTSRAPGAAAPLAAVAPRALPQILFEHPAVAPARPYIPAVQMAAMPRGQKYGGLPHRQRRRPRAEVIETESGVLVAPQGAEAAHPPFGMVDKRRGSHARHAPHRSVAAARTRARGLPASILAHAPASATQPVRIQAFLRPATGPHCPPTTSIRGGRSVGCAARCPGRTCLLIDAHVGGHILFERYGAASREASVARFSSFTLSDCIQEERTG
jgi:hypothetical protein